MKRSSLLFALTVTLALAAPVARGQSPFGNAISFNGINQYVAVTNFGNIIPTGEVTVEFWANTTAAAVQSAFMLSPDNDANRFNVHVNYGTQPQQGQTYWDFGSIFTIGRIGPVDAPVNSIGNWVHYAFVASQSGYFMSMYTNGVLMATQTGMTPFVRGAFDLHIGGNPGSFSYNGKLDEFRVWSVARTQAQIQSGMGVTLTGGEANLLVYYRFDGANGTVVTNSAVATGAAYNGTMVNGPGLVASTVPSAYVPTNLFVQGNILSDRNYNSDNGPTNSQFTLDFPITQQGILQNILTWGENDGAGGLSGVGQSFELFVLRPLNSTNYQVVFGTGYLTVANLGTNTFAVSGPPFGLRVGDVIAHYGRGIPLSLGTGGPSSVYIAANLPLPVVGTTITVPSPTYPLYNDGGRNYAIQVQAGVPSFLVTTNSDSGPGTLRQAVLDANAFASATIINFATNLSGQTITLTSGQIEMSNHVTIDASALPNGIQINGNGKTRIFQVDTAATVVLNSLTISNGYTSSNAGSGGIINYGNLTVNRSTLAGNSANYFGGAIVSSGILTVNQSTFFGNSCTRDGAGAILIYGGTASVNQSTITGNAGDFGSGIFSQGTLNLANTLCSGNTGSVDIYDNGGTWYAGSNLVGVADVMLAPLGNYGGPTPTMPPLPGSPAIDAGNDAVASFLVTDQRGYPRLSGAHVDIGAVEVQIATQLPALVNPATSGGLFQFGFTNLVGGSFTVFASTNLALPLNQWPNLGTAVEAPPGSGTFQFTDPQASTNYPRRFYRVRSP